MSTWHSHLFYHNSDVCAFYVTYIYIYCCVINIDIRITETTSETALDLSIYFYNPRLLYNHSISWGFDNLCINQTYIITNEPTPTPTNPPTMLLSECNNYKTRLSDWELLYDVSLTKFYPNGIKYVEFTSIDGFNQYWSDWLFAVDTNLYFPLMSPDPIWLNIEMHGFGSITNKIDTIRPIMLSYPIALFL